MDKKEKYISINNSIIHSKEIFHKSVGFLTSKRSSIDEYICVFIVGSYGRFEADVKSSDIEWLVVYDDTRVSSQEANNYQAKVTESFANLVGRERLSIGKTFGEVIALSDLTTNIGGIADNSRTLTYRMLCLAEGTPIVKNSLYDNIMSKLTNVYAGSHTAGHRMLSFATDISRYWRTLRIDYKQKIDEQKKPWAVRGLKLRGTRRYWYFSVILHFIAFGPRLDLNNDNLEIENDLFDFDVVKLFMKSLSNNPTERIIEASNKIQIETHLIDNLISVYEVYFNAISNKEIRESLDALIFENRYEDDNYVKLKKSCIELHSCMSDIVINLPEFYRKQIIEMFLL